MTEKTITSEDKTKANPAIRDRDLSLNATGAKPSFLPLIPLLVFFVLFLGTGIYYSLQGVDMAFYQLPAPIAVLPAIALSVLLAKDSIEKSIGYLLKGMGDSNIIAMCLIYLLAGAFGALTTQIGAVAAVVNLCLDIIPASFILPGLFLIAALVSFSMGTSMGTLAALAPIGVGLTESLQISPALVAGILLSGAMFGDNLSVISDTSIAAIRTQGTTATDKLKQNARWAIPAAVITVILYSIFAGQGEAVTIKPYDWYNLIPYAFILGLALLGWNVFVILTIGILSAIAIGLLGQSFSAETGVASTMYQGFTSMQDIFLLSMLIGGLGGLIKAQGGLDWLVHHVSDLFSVARSKLRAKLAILSTTAITNLAVANNTVSIILAGDVTHELAHKNKVKPKQSASLVDIGACSIQGVLPYGAQCLLLGTSFSISPLAPGVYAWYLPILLFITLVGTIKGKDRTN
ncbi:Na+/H+ antiporter NhaC family protein [Kangiella sediminilitoris]|uniref:Sodium:proton antiporter n=1 Tax=Kangiella sediminilitoris TaxID=1144748 RepID=A0A1B3B8R9_9GAMM|nr:Na+/H+ antiporter NhaC family protein [Kangiella sediminilitoris]AOE49175.1 sodium:proton antiporter [Kangiella sediminilitoris]